ncbi:MAG: hypothetical protein ACI8WP_001004, partial [Flavobacteriaceae bacterium]
HYKAKLYDLSQKQIEEEEPEEEEESDYKLDNED